MFYVDEASISLKPAVSTTYAPIGITPIIQINTDVNTRLYMASAISEQSNLEYMVRNQPFDTAAIIEFLIYLMSIFSQKLLIIGGDTQSWSFYTRFKRIKNFFSNLTPR